MRISHPSAWIWARLPFTWLHLGERNKVPVRKRFSRPQLLAHSANLPAALIGVKPVPVRTSWVAPCEHRGTPM
jgi:hypothetical protein